LSLGIFIGGRTGDTLYRLQMFGSSVISGLGLNKSCPRSVEIAAWDRALVEELLSTFDDGQVEIEIRLRLSQIEFSFLGLFRNLRLRCFLISGLSCSVSSVGIEGRGCEVSVLKCDQQLASTNMRSALYIELVYRRTDLRRQCRLREWSKNCVAPNLLGDGPGNWLLSGNGDYDFGRSFGLLATL
jgi:hypothetical protein